ncbi:MAG: cyclase family protein, partial [bacterium]|nr:cyclase family protein [bacterium]
TMSEGVKNPEMDITPMAAIATRAVFIDIARRRGQDALDPGDSVWPEELEYVLDRIEPGDAVVIRIGGTVRVGLAATELSEHGTWHHGTWAGLDTDCIDLLASRDVSLVATDSPGDTFPHRHEAYCRSPVHVLAEVFYGLPLIHNMDLEALGAACTEAGQDTFLLTVGPLNLPKGTGSLVTPVAVL